MIGTAKFIAWIGHIRKGSQVTTEFKRLNYDKIRKEYASVAMIFLIAASLFVAPSYGASGTPSWEFKGAYVNYTYDYSVSSLNNSSNVTNWRNLTGYELSKITSVENGNYTYSNILYPVENSSLGINEFNATFYRNSSFLVLESTLKSKPFKYDNPDIMPAVNASILRDLIANNSTLYFVGGPINIPLKVSQTKYDYRGTEIEAIKCFVTVNATSSNGSTQQLYQAAYVSSTSGIELGFIYNASVRAPITGRATQTSYFAMELNSTNIPVGNTYWKTHSILLLSLIVAIVAVIAIVSALVLQRKRRANNNN